MARLQCLSFSRTDQLPAATCSRHDECSDSEVPQGLCLAGLALPRPGSLNESGLPADPRCHQDALCQLWRVALAQPELWALGRKVPVTGRGLPGRIYTGHATAGEVQDVQAQGKGSEVSEWFG